MMQHVDALELAFEFIGLEEKPGKAHEKEIIKFFEDVGHGWVKDDETAWCAAFVGATLKRAGYPYMAKLNARSYLDWGDPVSVPCMGDITVLWRISPTSPYGHVGYYLGQDKNYVYLFGGNQSNQAKVSKYPKGRVLAYRRMTK